MSKIFLDGGDPQETREVVSLLGSLDGQTTQDMLKHAREMWSWIPNAHIKFPTTKAGLAAAEQSITEGMRVNMTLVFSQEQAAAVHAATRGAKRGEVFVSPFIGRLDDIGENGMDLIKNIKRMYGETGSHVQLLAASIRSTEHVLASLSYNADILTVPAKVIRSWVETGKPEPLSQGETGTGKPEGGVRGVGVPEGFSYDAKGLTPIPYKRLDLSKGWREFNSSHPLTDKGIERFAADWNALI